MKSKTASNSAKKHAHRKYFFSLLFILNKKTGASHKEVRVTEEWRIVSGKNKTEAAKKIMNYISYCESAEMMCELSKAKGNWRFAGLRGAWTLDDELTDGAEIAWFDHGEISKRKLRSLINNAGADVSLTTTRNYILNSIQT
jgi:hypothetical protein